MGPVITFFQPLITFVLDYLWGKLETKLNTYFEQKSQIKAISDEAASLKTELQGATSEAERFAILQKISDFGGRISL